MARKKKRKKNENDLLIFISAFYRLFLWLALIVLITAFGLKLFFYYTAKSINNSNNNLVKKNTTLNRQEAIPRATNLQEKVNVWDRAFVLKVNPDNGLPVGRSKLFNSNTTKYIYSWLRFTNNQFFIKNQHIVKWIWQDPSGMTVREFSIYTRSPQETGIDHFIYYWTVDVLDLSELISNGVNNDGLIGTWKVNVYIDNEFVYSDDFIIYNSSVGFKYPAITETSDIVVTNFVGEGKVFRQIEDNIKELPLENFMPVRENDEILIYAGYYTELLEEQDFPNSLFITNNHGSAFRAFSLASDLPKQDSRFKIVAMKNNKSVIKLSSGGIVVLEGIAEIINSETGEKLTLSAGQDIQDQLPAVRIDPYSKKFVKWDFIVRPTTK